MNEKVIARVTTICGHDGCEPGVECYRESSRIQLVAIGAGGKRWAVDSASYPFSMIDMLSATCQAVNGKPEMGVFRLAIQAYTENMKFSKTAANRFHAALATLPNAR